LDTNHHTTLPISTHCFICGKDNPAGLKSKFFVKDDVVILPLSATQHHCGYPDKVHGGVIAAALDECMGWAAARSIKRMCLTGELKVRYLRPVPVKEGLAVHAETVSAHRRMAHTRAVLKDEEGTEYARAEGKFVPLSAEDTLFVDDHLVYEGHEERVFDSLRAETRS